ncbi:hypothetical protein QBC34DRAFT_386711 [Podospora aff. communis PSN243]|uniref:F-box domain-containing protein n=1 Tax=Podospora aff. communis PSN243 TaxID=3040156 RepID=A0AAV9G2U7_9PEZI|nr:hypothetical protein QBC34DRAFT_386711 [Podospora aff. communis PSN243]
MSFMKQGLHALDTGPLTGLSGSYWHRHTFLNNDCFACRIKVAPCQPRAGHPPIFGCGNPCILCRAEGTPCRAPNDNELRYLRLERLLYDLSFESQPDPHRQQQVEILRDQAQAAVQASLTTHTTPTRKPIKPEEPKKPTSSLKPPRYVFNPKDGPPPPKLPPFKHVCPKCEMTPVDSPGVYWCGDCPLYDCPRCGKRLICWKEDEICFLCSRYGGRSAGGGQGESVTPRSTAPAPVEEEEEDDEVVFLGTNEAITDAAVMEITKPPAPTLLSIPAELRLLIYQSCLPSRQRLKLPSEPLIPEKPNLCAFRPAWLKIARSGVPSYEPNQLSLLRVCRQLSKETQDFLYRYNTFEFDLRMWEPLVTCGRKALVSTSESVIGYEKVGLFNSFPGRATQTGILSNLSSIKNIRINIEYVEGVDFFKPDPRSRFGWESFLSGLGSVTLSYVVLVFMHKHLPRDCKVRVCERPVRAVARRLTLQ